MKTEIRGQEIPLTAPARYILPVFEPGLPEIPLELAYTKAQKNWLARAYDNHYFLIARGVFVPIRREEVNYHHILPAAYLIERYNCDPNQLIPSKGFMGIPLLKWEHNNLIHPDIAQAIKEYHANPKSIKEAIDKHHELARQGKTFWNTRYDQMLLTAARIKITEYQQKNPTDKYPVDPSWEKKHGRRQ